MDTNPLTNPLKKQDLNHKIYLNFLSVYSAKGYTLTEILTAGLLASLVISAILYGMIIMLKNNQIASANSTISYHVNRAAEFIKEEIQSANFIESDAATTVDGFTLPTGATAILVLKSSDDDYIVYYTQAASDPWVGPNAIYRWGYPLDDNGNYDKTQSPSSEVLIDNIDNTIVAPSCQVDSLSTTPASVTNKGFSACVKDNRLVEFNLNATTEQFDGTTVNYGLKTMSYVRGSTEE